MDTERLSPRYSGIDTWDPSDVLDAMIDGQFAAVAAVRAARGAIERAALAVEAQLRDGGRLVYAGAGTSGRLAVQDGAELMPTFSWPNDRLLLFIAGGDEALLRAKEGAEDELGHAVDLVRAPRHFGERRADRGRGERHDALHARLPARGEGRAARSPSASPTTPARRSWKRPNARSVSRPGRSRSPARRA